LKGPASVSSLASERRRVRHISFIDPDFVSQLKSVLIVIDGIKHPMPPFKRRAVGDVANLGSQVKRRVVAHHGYEARPGREVFLAEFKNGAAQGAKAQITA
jgi:hypothetical protein